MPELFNEKDARARAAKMGEGVRFVSSRKITVEGMEGQEATYAFSDMTKLKLNEKPETPSMPGLQCRSFRECRRETTFRFSKLPNGHSQLIAVFLRAAAQESFLRRAGHRAEQSNQGANRRAVGASQEILCWIPDWNGG